MNTIQERAQVSEQSALDRAIAYLDAKEVAPRRYAVQQGPRYLVVPANILEELTWLAPNGKVLQSNPHTSAIPGAIEAGVIIALPAWWTPERQFALTATHGCTREPRSRKVDMPNCITVDLVTGEEVPA